jgi:ArsR family transcriptional regulator
MAGDGVANKVDKACTADESLAQAVPEERIVSQTSQILKGFADETRLRILCLLRGREVCVHKIVEALGMSQSAVSHQLRVLRGANLVANRRDGRHVYYRLADDHVREMLENALSHGAEDA